MKNDVIDVEFKDVQIEQFLTEKRPLIRNAVQKTVEGYIETGKQLQEVNERLATNSLHSTYSAFIGEFGFTRDYASKAISVYKKYGSSGCIIDNTSSVAILQALAAPSNDPEKVALVEQKLVAGEKMTVAQVKEVLKKMPESERNVVSQATYEVDEETRLNMTQEEIQADHKRADDFIANELPIIKQEAKENRKATYQEGLAMLGVYAKETKEVQEWIFKLVAQIPIENQPSISKEALLNTLNIIRDGACAEVEVLEFIENNINTY